MCYWKSFFLFLNQNICCGYLKESSYRALKTYAQTDAQENINIFRQKKVFEKIFLASYNQATSNLAIYSHETSQDKLLKA